MKLQKQHGPNDCGLAAIATLVGRDYDELWPEAFKIEIQEKGLYGENVDKALGIAGFVQGEDYRRVSLSAHMRADYHIKHLLWKRKAVFQVPSLNQEGKSHMIVWTGEEILDPSNQQVYQWIGQCFIENAWIFDETTNNE
jgi:hypothetical protein